MMFRGRDPGPDPAAVAALMALPMPARLEAAGTDWLGWAGAVPFSQAGTPRYGDFYVYGLYDAAGECFYVGLSNSLLSRLSLWQRTYGDYLAGIRVLRCADEDDMNRTENWLIGRMQPRENTRGTETEERRRQARAQKAPRPYGGPGRGTYDRDKARAWRRARGEEVAG